VTTLLVPKSQLGRAGGMVQIGEAISALASPAIAGVLFVTVGIQGVVMVDFATYLVAILTLLVVRVPRPPATEAGAEGRGSLLHEAAYGWRYITARKGLLGLLVIFAATNFLTSLWNPLLPPMILEMSSPAMLGYLGSVVGVGMLMGTLVMSAWGGPKRRIHGVLAFLMISGVFQMLLGVSPSLVLIAIAGFGAMFTMPIINGSSQAIWQTKVAPDVQGRVFAVRRMIAWSAMPLAYLVAGLLADRVFNPLLVEGGVLASTVGQVLGVGPARGTGLLFIISGLLSVLVAAGGYLYPHIHYLEDELPDAMPEKPAETVPVGEASIQ